MHGKKADSPVIWAWVPTVVFLGCAYLLISGSPWLERTAIESIGLPVGTLVAWAGIISLPTAIYLGAARRLSDGTSLSRFCRPLLIAELVLAGCWGIVAYGLAGNWAFAFSGRAPSFRGSDEASTVFWAYSAGVVLAALLLLSLLLASRLFSDSNS